MIVKYLERLYSRLRQVASLGKLTAVDDTGPVQIGQLYFGPNQVVDGAPLPQQFGFSSKAPLGSDVVAVCLEGDRSKTIGVAINNQGLRYRNLPNGGTVVYDVNGNYFLLTDAGIALFANNLPVTVSGASSLTANINGPIALTGTVIQLNGPVVMSETLAVADSITDLTGTGNADTLGELRTAYDDHTHDVQEVQGGIDTITTTTTNLPV